MKNITSFFLSIIILHHGIQTHAENNHAANEMHARNIFSSSENETNILEHVITKNKDDNQLSIHCNEIPTRDILTLLAKFKGSNMILANTVKGNITLHLNNISWQQALDTILMLIGLGKYEQNDILFIAPISEIAAFEEQSLRAQTLRTETFQIYYAKATGIAELLDNKKNNLLSPRGNVVVDTRTNVLWIKDTPNHLDQVRNLLKKIDIPSQQVLIAARIVNVDENFAEELGLKFGTIQPKDNDAKKSNHLHMDIPLTISDVGHFTLAIAKLGETTLLDMELSALERAGKARIISNPELITANHVAAFIESGQEIPYQEKTSGGSTSITFKKAVLSLKVTPDISPENNKILLNLSVNQDKVSPLTVNGVPAINTQEIQTQILVNDGETIVLGGIYEQSNSNMTERIPFWGSIPILGALFTHKATHSERKELLIFVTPRIL